VSGRLNESLEIRHDDYLKGMFNYVI
jgi:hypothetical protein